MTDTPNREFSDEEDAVDHLAESFLERLRAGESPSIEEWSKQHPHLAPSLEKRLKLVVEIFRSSKADDKAAKPDSPTVRDERLIDSRHLQTVAANIRLACPHCGNNVQVVGRRMSEVTCGSCGSAVKISPEATSTMSGDSLPKELGRFAVKRVLGEGAFGIVFLAVDPRLDREVAIKMPRSGYFATREEEQRFFREAKHAAGLKHPNIVQVYEITGTDRVPLIVSEYIQGLTLNDLASAGLLSFKETARLMVQIANAVEFAHQKGVIHRDLKPGNILVDEDRNAYVTDFGLARRDDLEITMTLDGAILGTPAYMSPEQAVGNHKLVGRRSDVYSLGVILYRLIAQELPFHGTKRMLVHQVAYDEPKPPRSFNEFIPRDLETITLKAMAKSPDARYQSAKELADELQRFLMDEPIRARPVSGLVHFISWCKRNPAIAALSGTIAALLFLGMVTSSLWAWRSSYLRTIADQNAERATASERESSQRLYDVLMNNGSSELNRNNLPYASLWFTEGLAIQDNENNRTRIAMIQDRIPTLSSLWVTGSNIRNAAFSADGARLAAACENRIQVYEVQTKTKVFDELFADYHQFSLAQDGAKFAVSSRLDFAELWNINERKLTSKLQHAGYVASVDFNPSSSKLATGSLDSFVKVWSANDGSLLAQHEFKDKLVRRIKFVQDSNLLIVTLYTEDKNECEIVIWNHEDNSVVAERMLHDSHIVSISVSDDAKAFCSGEARGVIKVWEVASGAQIGSSIVTTNKLDEVLLSKEQNLVTGLFADGEVSTFDIASGARVGATIRSDEKWKSLTHSPDKSILALSSTKGQASFYRRESGRSLCTPVCNGNGALSIAFHPDGRRVALGGNNGVIQIWDLAGASPNSFVLQHSAQVRNAIFVPKTNRCLTVALDGKGYIWDSLTGERVGKELEHSDGIAECAVTESGNLVATAALDNYVKLWDSFTGVQFGNGYQHDAAVMFVRFNQDGSRFISGDAEGAIRCWEVSANKSVEPKALFTVNHTEKILWLTYSPDGSTFASASLDGMIRIWDSTNGLPKFMPLKHGNSATYCEFLPDGKRLVSVGADRWVNIWNLEKGEVMQKLPTVANSMSIQVLEKGKLLVSTDNRGATYVWREDENGTFKLSDALSHPANDSAYFTALDTRNSILATCGGWLGLSVVEPQTGSLVLWSLADQRLMAPPLQHNGPIRRVYFNNNFDRLLTASEDRTARLWKVSRSSLPSEELQRIARLYAQASTDESSRLKGMEAELQLKEFASLSAANPSYFTVDLADQAVWEFERKREAGNV